MLNNNNNNKQTNDNNEELDILDLYDNIEELEEQEYESDPVNIIQELLMPLYEGYVNKSNEIQLSNQKLMDDNKNTLDGLQKLKSENIVSEIKKEIETGNAKTLKYISSLEDKLEHQEDMIKLQNQNFQKVLEKLDTLIDENAEISKELERIKSHSVSTSQDTKSILEDIEEVSGKINQHHTTMSGKIDSVDENVKISKKGLQQLSEKTNSNYNILNNLKEKK